MSREQRFYRGKTAVVTGAGSGIGRAIAVRLAGHGATVHCVDRDIAAARDVAQALDGASAHEVDVTDSAAVDRLAETVFAESGRIDMLFNNAGIGHAGRVVDTSIEDWRQVMDVNVMGVVHGLHAFLPRMQAQAGRAHIVNTASGAGLISLPRMAAYCASKHAVVGLSQSLAAELHGSRISVTILCPGVINTAIVSRTTMRGAALDSQAKAVAFYEKNGASPDKVAADLLTDVRRGRLFCITPRGEVGIGWLAQRVSPTLAQYLTRAQTRWVLGK